MTQVRDGSATGLPEAARAELGLPQATALVLGSIIGVGVFNLPYSLAGFGPISLAAMALTSVGAVALALLFASLSRRSPAGGGPYAYSRAAFGDGVGFANAWSYWITAWAGNAAIVTGWVFYVERYVNRSGDVGWAILIALVGLWVPAAVNLTGVRNTGAFQLWTSVLKYLPLALIGTVGLLVVRTDNFRPWNAAGGSTWTALGGAMAICLFSYLGVETAAVVAARVRDPGRAVPRATVLGTLASAAVYLLSLVAVFGTVPSDQLALDANKASYSVAADVMVGGGSWAGDLVAVAVIVSGLGALNGWTMICGEMPRAAAQDGLFPAVFARLSPRRAVPVTGVVASTALASLATVVSFLGTRGATVFTTLVLMTGITAALPYAFSALAQLRWLWDGHAAGRRHRRRPGQQPGPAALARDLVVAVAALAFSVLFIYWSRNTAEASWYVVWGPFLMTSAALAAGVPVYLYMRSGARRLGQGR
jgi:basic amino acid/polyamine antiporter, APA family